MENENNVKKQIQGATNPTLNKPKLYDKQYYVMFFSIMITAFIVIFWLCNYTKLKEMFQVIALTALAIAIAEYSTRKYLNL